MLLRVLRSAVVLVLFESCVGRRESRRILNRRDRPLLFPPPHDVARR